MQELPENSHRGNEAMYLANEMINTIEVDNIETYNRCLTLNIFQLQLFIYKWSSKP